MFQVKPNYTGSPGTNQYFISLGPITGLPENAINIYHTSAGNLVCEVYDYRGLILVSMSSAWSPTSGTTYELELNIDIGDGWQLDTGATRLFVDGTQLGSTNTSIGSKHLNNYRNRDVQYINLCTDRTHTFTSNHSISELIIFKAVQHTGNYSPANFAFADSTDYRTITDITGEVITIDTAFDITINTAIHYLAFTDFSLVTTAQRDYGFIADTADGFTYDDSAAYVIS